MAEFKVGDRVEVTIAVGPYMTVRHEGVVIPYERPEGPPPGACPVQAS